MFVKTRRSSSELDKVHLSRSDRPPRRRLVRQDEWAGGSGLSCWFMGLVEKDKFGGPSTSLRSGRDDRPGGSGRDDMGLGAVGRVGAIVCDLWCDQRLGKRNKLEREVNIP